MEKNCRDEGNSLKVANHLGKVNYNGFLCSL